MVGIILLISLPKSAFAFPVHPLPFSAFSHLCPRIPTAVTCDKLLLVQVRMSPVQVANKILRRKIHSLLVRSLRYANRAVFRIGISIRRFSRTTRIAIQRRFVRSICCKARIEANAISHDLSLRFPSARVETVLQFATSDRQILSPITNTINLVMDQSGLKLVFNGCLEIENREQRVLRSDASDAIVDNNGRHERVDVSRAEKFKACVNWDTGKINYQRLLL